MAGVLPIMEAIVADGKILNHEALKRFYAERHRRQEIIRAGMFADIETLREVAPLLDCPCSAKIRSFPY